MKDLHCLLCGINVVARINSKVPHAFELSLSDGKKLWEIFNDITKSRIGTNELQKKSFCQKCFKQLESYWNLRKNLQSMETNITKTYKKTQMEEIKKQNRNPNKKMVVLPASKLKPLPTMGDSIKENSSSTIIINNKKYKFSTINDANKNDSEISINFEEYEKSQSVNSDGNRSILKDSIDSSRSLIKNSTEDSLESISVNNIRNKLIKALNSNQITEGDESGHANTNLVISKDDIVFQISEDTTADEDQNEEDNRYEYSTEMNEREDTTETEYVFGDVEILDENEIDDESDTILMSDSGLLRVVQADSKFLTLLNESQDSNDESQIELQVSGDEETANAIIAAASEEGGAYIKVESGNVLRVTSVTEKNEDLLEEIPQEKASSDIEVIKMIGSKFDCQLCKNRKNPETFTTMVPDLIMDHLRSEHNARVYICPNCHEIFKKKKDFTDHIATHKKDPLPQVSPYECSVCNKQFLCKVYLDQHMNKHTGAKPYTCDECQKSFSSKYVLQAHMKTHTERERPFKCKICKKGFFTQSNYNAHVKIHSASKDFSCTVCHKKFYSQHNLDYHAVVHSKDKKYACAICDKTFARKPGIEDHMRVHSGERPFACDMCPRRFSQRSNLHSHKRATHFELKRHICAICNKGFKRKRLLLYHTRSVHTGERPHACHCGSTFVYPEHLAKHQRIHANQREFACEICGKTFNKADTRNSHRFVHSDKKPYECLSCGSGFMRKHLLYAHMNSSGHITESIVVNQPRLSQIDLQNTETQSKLEVPEEENNDEEEIIQQSTSDLVPAEHTVYLTAAASNELQDESKPMVISNDDGTESYCLTTDATEKYVTKEDGSYMRLVQVELPGGGEGWLALDTIME